MNDQAPATPPGRVRHWQHHGTPKRRDEILTAASEAFASRGFAGATLADIAAAAGVSAPTILHHFGSKEALLTEVLAARDRSIELVAQTVDLRGLHFLEHLVDTAALNMVRPGITQLYAVLSAESVTTGHPAQAFFRSRYRGLREMVTGAVRDSLADPEAVDERAAAEVASSIIALLDGLQVQWLLEPRALDMAALAKRTIRALIEDLRRDPADQDRERWPGPETTGDVVP